MHININKLLLILLVGLIPIASGLSNIFSVYGAPQSILTLVLLMFMLLSAISSLLTHSIMMKSKLLILFLMGYVSYFLFSNYFFMILTGDVVLKNILLLLIAYLPFVWVAFVNIDYQNFVSSLRMYSFSSVFISVVFILLALPFILLKGPSSWAYISMELLPNRNDTSVIIAFALLVIYFIDIGLARIPKFIMLLILSVALLLTFSRSIYIFYVLFLLFAFIESKSKIKSLFFSSIAVVAFLYFSPINPVAERLNYTFSNESVNSSKLDDSTLTRLSTWSHAINCFEKSPIFGVGYSISPYICSGELPGNENAKILFSHNYFITQIYQGGLIGFFLTILLLLFFIFSSFRVRMLSVRLLLFGSLFLFMIASLTGEPLYGFPKYIFLFLFCYISGYKPKKG